MWVNRGGLHKIGGCIFVIIIIAFSQSIERFVKFIEVVSCVLEFFSFLFGLFLILVGCICI